jgi:hypothetical protein
MLLAGTVHGKWSLAVTTSGIIVTGGFAVSAFTGGFAVSAFVFLAASRCQPLFLVFA